LGNGSDGALEITATKDVESATFAEDPRAAKFDGMPRAAIASGYVTFVFPPFCSAIRNSTP